MKTTLLIIQLLYPAAILILTLTCNKPHCRLAKWFRRRMVLDESFRKLYMTILAMLVLFYSFTFTRTQGPGFALLPAFLYGLILLRYKFTYTMLCYLHDDHVVQLMWFALMSFSLMTPQMMSLTTSLALTMCSALFWPSAEVRDSYSLSYTISQDEISREEAIERYY